MVGWAALLSLSLGLHQFHADDQGTFGVLTNVQDRARLVVYQVGREGVAKRLRAEWIPDLDVGRDSLMPWSQVEVAPGGKHVAVVGTASGRAGKGNSISMALLDLYTRRIVFRWLDTGHSGGVGVGWRSRDEMWVRVQDEAPTGSARAERPRALRTFTLRGPAWYPTDAGPVRWGVYGPVEERRNPWVSKAVVDQAAQVLDATQYTPVPPLGRSWQGGTLLRAGGDVAPDGSAICAPALNTGTQREVLVVLRLEQGEWRSHEIEMPPGCAAACFWRRWVVVRTLKIRGLQLNDADSRVLFYGPTLGRAKFAVPGWAFLGWQSDPHAGTPPTGRPDGAGEPR